MTFEAYTIPAFNSGRWMVMDAGDMDRDGDTDLILGSSTVPFHEIESQWQQPVSLILIIENTIHDSNKQ